MNPSELYFVGALLGAAGSGVFFWRVFHVKHQASRRWAQVRLSAGIEGARKTRGSSAQQVADYMKRLSQTLSLGVSRRILPSESFKRARCWFLEYRQKAGVSADTSADGFIEASVRLALLLGALGALTGALFSTGLLMIGMLGGLIFGASLPTRSLKTLAQQRDACLGRELPEMLEVCALGLRSGLSFDRSFALYVDHFSSTLARECAAAQSLWSMGLMTRDEALRDLGNSYNSTTLDHAIESIIRALRFGTSLVESLETSAVQARFDYRNAIEQKVAKAPVKMMIPTGTLILPAMLLLVLGPVLLQLMEGM